jgi:cbb3-type cytochrome oxidase subunit 3
MKQAVLKHFDLPWLPLTALVIFVVCFGLYAYWTYKKSNRQFYQDASMIPLNDAETFNKNVAGENL